MSGSASVIALGTALILWGGTARAGDCTETGGAGSGVWECSGPAAADTTQAPASAAGGDLIVTTTPGFGLNVGAGNAFTLTNGATEGSITFTDANTSAITGAAAGINAQNNGTGALSITTTGQVTGGTGSGIVARNESTGTDLTINAASVSSTAFSGISARNFGSGALSVTATGLVSGGPASSGIFVRNYVNGTDLTVNAATVNSGLAGINARNYGTGALSITATGNVTSGTDAGIVAQNESTGTSLTITAAGVSSSGFSGISARNFGSGALTITATGQVSGSPLNSGIFARNYVNGTDLTINAAGVNGGYAGINARNYGTGALSITATGDVVAGTSRGIYARNESTGTSLTINATNVSSTGYSGIAARNFGTGALSITSTGLVTSSAANSAIFAYNYANGTDLTINAASAASGYRGINVRNFGTGALSITATGDVSGGTDEGIFAQNESAGTSLTINATTVSSADGSAIAARNFGSGALSVVTTGLVSGGLTGNGMFVRNYSNGTDLTISAAGVIGGAAGIDARNYGSGAMSVSATGDVTGGTGAGILAQNEINGTSLTVSAANVSSTGGAGISAANYGTGALGVTASGLVSGGPASSGMFVRNNVNGTDLTISAAGVIGGAAGIDARNYGTGAMSVSATGDVTGGTGAGILAQNEINGTSLTVSAVSVNGGTDGIRAVNYGSGLQSVTVSGAVTGGTGAGINTVTIAGGQTQITLENGADVSSGSGIAIANDDGDSITTLNAGSSVTGEIRLGNGSDDLVVAGGDISGATLLDGGDDSSTADGFIDRLIFSGQNLTLTGANLINWEIVTIDGGSLAFSDMALAVGDGSLGTGLNIINGAALNAGGMFTLNGNLVTDAGGLFNATGGGAGVYTINGNVSNDGVLSSQDGVAGDQITINGDYTGNGVVRLDTVFGDDTSATDQLIVSGSTSGSSTLNVANIGGTGDVTTLGIELVSVGGVSAGTFVLDGDFVTEGGDQAIMAGAYAYTLVQGAGGSWNLVSEAVSTPMFQPGSPIYEAYPQTFLTLAALPSLKQRVGTRHDQTMSIDSPQLGFAAAETKSPFWIQVEGVSYDFRPASSTTTSQTDLDLWRLRAGVDFMLSQSASGDLVGGVNLQYATVSSNVTSGFGNGSVDTDGYAIGLSTTWYGANGLYLDSQLQYGVYDSDLSSATLGALASGLDGRGFSSSIEMGRPYQIGTNLNLTPQAQLTYSRIYLDGFTGPVGENVSIKDVESLQMRLGVAMEHSVDTAVGQQEIFGIFNLYHEFAGKSDVDVSGVRLSSSPEDWSVEFGIGGAYSWGSGMSLFGNVAYATGLDNFGDSHRLKGTLGLRMDF